MKLIMTVGLPASGKSTWAREQEDYVVVEKDEIRRKLEAEGWVWSPENEKRDVVPERNRLIRAAMDQGKSVISADTNFAKSHQKVLELLAKEYGAEFVVKRFNTPVDECIKRDALRTGKAYVGEKVIRDMARMYHVEQDYSSLKPVEPVKDLLPAIICDLDGTLCLNNGHRSHYDASTCDKDELNHVVRNILEVYYRFMDYRIVYLSGREDQYRPPTETFFKKHHIPPGPLFMRPTGDFRKDWIVKSELFDAHVRGKYDVKFVLDDRDQVVKMWRQLGLVCLQVAPGDF